MHVNTRYVNCTRGTRMHPKYVSLHEVTWYGAWFYVVHRTCQAGSSFKWHQPCKNPTVLQLQATVTHLESHNNNRVVTVSHHVRAQSTYKDMRTWVRTYARTRAHTRTLSVSLSHTRTHACTHPHTLQMHYAVARNKSAVSPLERGKYLHK